MSLHLPADCGMAFYSGMPEITTEILRIQSAVFCARKVLKNFVSVLMGMKTFIIVPTYNEAQNIALGRYFRKR